jgi:hypothetical protein
MVLPFSARFSIVERDVLNKDLLPFIVEIPPSPDGMAVGVARTWEQLTAEEKDKIRRQQGEGAEQYFKTPIGKQQLQGEVEWLEGTSRLRYEEEKHLVVEGQEVPGTRVRMSHTFADGLATTYYPNDGRAIVRSAPSKWPSPAVCNPGIFGLEADLGGRDSFAFLSDVLEKGGKVRVSQEAVRGHESLRFEFVGPNRRSFVLWLDAASGCFAWKIRALREDGKRLYEAEVLEARQGEAGPWFPQKGVYTWFAVGDKPNMVGEYALGETTFGDAATRGEAFVIPLAEGTEVSDERYSRRYFVDKVLSVPAVVEITNRIARACLPLPPGQTAPPERRRGEQGFGSR